MRHDVNFICRSCGYFFPLQESSIDKKNHYTYLCPDCDVLPRELGGTAVNPSSLGGTEEKESTL